MQNRTATTKVLLSISSALAFTIAVAEPSGQKADSAPLKSMMVQVPICIANAFSELVQLLEATDLPRAHIDFYKEMISYMTFNKFYAPEHVLFFATYHSLLILKLAPAGKLPPAKKNFLKKLLQEYERYLLVKKQTTGKKNEPIINGCFSKEFHPDDPCVPCTSNPWFCCYK